MSTTSVKGKLAAKFGHVKINLAALKPGAAPPKKQEAPKAKPNHDASFEKVSISKASRRRKTKTKFNINEEHNNAQETSVFASLFASNDAATEQQETATSECKTDTKAVADHRDQQLFIVLRGFPGAGKSSLSAAIRRYYGNCVCCSFDKYHWSGKEEGKGEFQFDFRIHRDTKKWCREEIETSIANRVPVIIVDNGNFEKWEYKDFVKLASTQKYKVLIIEIKSETSSISRKDHVKHMETNRQNAECLLCIMQHQRCKMSVPNNALKKFINKWQKDSNAVVVDPKLEEDEKWTDDELKTLLSTQKTIDLEEYKDDDVDALYKQGSGGTDCALNRQRSNHNGDDQHNRNWRPNKRRTFDNQDPSADPFNSTLDEMIQHNKRKRQRYNHYPNRRNNYHHRNKY